MSGHQYITNSNNLFEDVDDETFLKNSRIPESNSNGDFDRQAYEQRKMEIQDSTLSSTNRSIGLLRETEKVGIATAEELARQREQLENTSEKLDEINSSLNVSQKHLNGIKSVFSGLKNYLSGTKRVSISSSDSKSSESPPESSKSEAIQKNAPHPIHNLRSDNNSSKQQSSGPGTFDEQLERNLQYMSANISNLKGLAHNLNEEIDTQNDLIDNIQDKVEGVDIKLNKQNKQIHKLLK